ncbi:LysR substrate-binding domain-containing protein [Glutamicibacter endophyticus]|uniref:LysR substrate-binding domain-containing protein n=1 Tax=Glutamicibacter endophyticus TaxID=1522174 RepID=UPI003AEF6347
MVRHAKRVLTDLDALMADVATAAHGSQDREEIKLGIFPSLATYALPQILTADAWPGLGINLRLWIGEPQQTVAGLGTGGDLDLALIFQVGPGGLTWPASLERTWLGDDNFRVVIPASWPIGDDSQLTVDQLAEWPWILHHPGTSDATLIARLFASYNIHPQVAAYCDDFNASLHLVSSGLGAALVPDLAMAQAPAGIRVVDAPEIRLARSIFALKPENSKKPKANLVLDRLAQILAN